MNFISTCLFILVFCFSCFVLILVVGMCIATAIISPFHLLWSFPVAILIMAGCFKVLDRIG